MIANRRHLLQAGLAIAATASGWAVRAQPADPTASWNAAAANTDPDPRIRALAWAVLAPNPHNRQPWIAELPRARPDTILLRCDLDRRLSVTDPLDRQITIGLGCFAELARMALAQQGHGATITPFPEGEPRPRLDDRPVAVICLVGGAVADPLFAAALTRRSSKRPFDMARPVPPEAIAALSRSVSAPIGFGAATDPDRVAMLRDIAWRAWQIEAATEAAHLETVNLMRLGSPAVAAQPDGVSVYGPGLDQAIAAGQITRESMLPGGAGYAIMIDRYTPMLAATPAQVWLTSPGDSRAEALAAGRDWLRLNLAATGAGLSLHPISQALQEFPEMAAPYAEIHAMLAPGQKVQMLGRLGYAPPAPPTPRWPAETRTRAV